jgi:prephenate dehydrogenase
MAGRERGGPGAARADLFDDAAWIVTPYATTEARAEADAVLLGRLVGGRPQLLTPDDHDAAVGVVSHVPQVVASALASLLDAAPSGAAEVAGGGFRDTTRLADSDPALWGPILAGNAPATARGLDRLIGLLGKVRDGLLAGSPAVAVAVMEQGRRMRASLPGKSGRAGPSWASVGVVIEDRPGELARLFAAAGSAGVNIEDLHIEHAPDHPAGHVTLYVSPESTNQLIDKLSSSGWAAHRSD